MLLKVDAGFHSGRGAPDMRDRGSLQLERRGSVAPRLMCCAGNSLHRELLLASCEEDAIREKSG